ncbi:MAG: hypothetical protein IJ681_02960 [Bacteroidales bacterium]|nr:hypothetical protein [Bacteroidales bacterium]
MDKRILNFSKLLVLSIIALSFFACGDNESTKLPPIDNGKDGLYILCEGVFQHNNSALDFYPTDSSIEKDIFQTVNSMGLGETANDMIKVGNELWIAVSGSATVMILNLSDGALLKMIPIVNERGVNRQPRHLIQYGNYVYLTCFDGNVIKISVKNKEISGILNTKGRNPEGIATAKGKIYVTNSGGLDFPNYDTSVSVIDPTTFSVEKLIKVKDNPQVIKAYNNKVYVVSTGDYSDSYRLTVIEDGEKKDSVDMNITDFAFYNGFLYYIYKPWGSGKATLNKLDVNNIHSAPVEFAKVPEKLVTPYRICIINDTIYVCDNKNATVSGEVFVFNNNDGFLYSFETSIGPNTIIKKK